MMVRSTALLHSERVESGVCAAPPRKQLLNPMLRGHAEVPTDAIVDPVQAESAFGHVQATELDDEDLEALDAALRALLGCHVNPVSAF